MLISAHPSSCNQTAAKLGNIVSNIAGPTKMWLVSKDDKKCATRIFWWTTTTIFLFSFALLHTQQQSEKWEHDAANPPYHN